MTLGEIIKEYRDTHNISQRQFALMCGLSNGYISMLEKNENPKTRLPLVPSLSAYKAIAEVMGTSLNDLLKMVDDMPVDISDDEWTIRFRNHLAEELVTINREKVEKFGIDLVEFERIAAGELALTFEKACCIADALGVSVEYLLGNETKTFEGKKSPLTEDRQGELINVLRDIGALNNDGLLSDSGLRTVTNLLRNNAEMLKHFINEDK